MGEPNLFLTVFAANVGTASKSPLGHDPVKLADSVLSSTVLLGIVIAIIIIEPQDPRSTQIVLNALAKQITAAILSLVAGILAVIITKAVSA